MEKHKVEMTESILYIFFSLLLLEKHPSSISFIDWIGVSPSLDEINTLELFGFIKPEPICRNTNLGISILKTLDRGKKFIFDGAKIPSYLLVKRNEVVEESKLLFSVNELVKHDMKFFEYSCNCYHNPPNKIKIFNKGKQNVR
jgi:hypothetical protein